MINQATLDPSLLAQSETRSHGTLVQEMGRNQTRIGRLARAASVTEPAPASDSSSVDKLARMADAQATANVAGAARQFDVTTERLMSMSYLAAAARATDLTPGTRDDASRQFETLKWQAIAALRDAASMARAGGAWQFTIDPGQISHALAPLSIATPDAAVAAETAIDNALSTVDSLRTDTGAVASDGNEADQIDTAELAARITAQASASTGAQANIAPANARTLLS
jgi:flagellin-like hook-associated protein FlgL